MTPEQRAEELMMTLGIDRTDDDARNNIAAAIKEAVEESEADVCKRCTEANRLRGIVDCTNTMPVVRAVSRQHLQRQEMRLTWEDAWDTVFVCPPVAIAKATAP